MKMDERVRWLSSVCEVITEPSIVASLPQVMEVQPSGSLPTQSVLSTWEKDWIVAVISNDKNSMGSLFIELMINCDEKQI